MGTRYLKIGYFIALISSVFFLEGFIFYAKPELDYDKASLPRSDPKNISIYVEDFKDVRNDKGGGAIGEVCNAFFKTGDVKEPNGIEEWATDAFKKELVNAGYNVLDTSSSLQIKGKILSLYVSVGMKYEASVTVSIALINNSSTIFEKMYTGSYKKSEILQMDISKGASKALNAGLKDAIKQCLSDINSATHG